MKLTGFPDFARPIDLTSGCGFLRYRQAGTVLLPSAVSIATNEHDLPALRLDLVRPSLPIGQQGAHALLAIELQADYKMAEAQHDLLELGHDGLVQACDAEAGCVYFAMPSTLADSHLDLAQEISAASDIDTCCADRHRLLRRLSVDAGVFWKNLILDGTLLLEARLVYLIKGVSPRVFATIRFQSNDLLVKLHSLIAARANENSSQTISYPRLIELLKNEINTLPITITESEASTQTQTQTIDEENRKQRFICEALADRLITRFAETSINSDGDLVCRFQEMDDHQTVRIEWDLAEAHLAYRVWSAMLSSFTSNNALSLAQRKQLIREQQLPFFQSNKVPINVYANLPTLAASVLAVQAKIMQEAAPPERPVAFQKTLNLSGQEPAAIHLHVDQTNQVEYRYSTKLVLHTDQGLLNLTNDAQISSDPSLILGPQSFAAQLLSASLDEVWATAYQLEIRVRFDVHNVTHLVSGELGDEHTRLVFCIPSDAENITSEVSLIEPRSGQRLTSIATGLTTISISPFSYPQCGQQTVEVQGHFEDGRQWRAVELQPVTHGEDAPTQAAPQIIRLTPDAPQQSWRWFSHSPFDVAYRYRELDHLGHASHDWITRRYPFTPLHLGRNKDQHAEPIVVTGSR